MSDEQLADPRRRGGRSSQPTMEGRTPKGGGAPEGPSPRKAGKTTIRVSAGAGAGHRCPPLPLAVPPLRCYPRCRSPRATLRRRSRTLRTLRTLRTAAHNAGRADAAAADAPESAPVSRVSTWHEASVVRCRAWRGWGSGTPCHDEEAVAAVVEELPRHLRHSGVRSRASLHSWRAKQVFLAHFLPMRCGHWQSGCSPGGSEPSKLSCAAAHENSCAAAHDL
jgi:hypothetical protein